MAADVTRRIAPPQTGDVQTRMADPGGSTIGDMATVRLFAAARDAAGVGRDEIPGTTVDEVLGAARDRYGATFEAVLRSCKIWVNGEPASGDDPIATTDELAVLPPVSGGCT